MRDDDAARAFREAYSQKRPDLIPDDDHDNPNALGMGHDHADVAEPEDETGDGDERTIRARCASCDAIATVAPPHGFRFVERDHEDVAGVVKDAKLRWECPECGEPTVITALKTVRLARIEGTREAADVFAREYAARTGTPEWGSEDDEPSRFFRESYAQAEDDDLWRRCCTQYPRG
jgi:hypothetical protein